MLILNFIIVNKQFRFCTMADNKQENAPKEKNQSEAIEDVLKTFHNKKVINEKLLRCK